MKAKLRILGILCTTLTCSTAYAQVGIQTETPKRTLHVNGSLQVTNEVNVGGTANTAGSAGTSGQVLTSKGSGVPPEWQATDALKGSVANSIYIQGTTALNVPRNTVADVPGVTTTITVPAGKTQLALFLILGYAHRTVTLNDAATQGVFTLLQNGTKISSAYTSSVSSPSRIVNVNPNGTFNSAPPNTQALANLPIPVSFFKAVPLTAGTYTFKVQYSSWFGDQTVNYNPSDYIGYNNDNEAMLTKMQVFIFNN
ncbi:hypothetical protein SAMN05421594_4266 [Chryseobacterium oleae]|uniref:DUF4397 domain-containing protein n=1 Tax=Chryseobacterium oleae TaxID=491207 RepID=A0A1I5BYC7_CHROL|nr:hypothetical protein [Chryseobacterium oleae]SFN79695.1 hypothetical protein SAMN05421594_4266 [Chryseobacterium oleae]